MRVRAAGKCSSRSLARTASLGELSRSVAADSGLWKQRRSVIVRDLARLALLLDAPADKLPAYPSKLIQTAMSSGCLVGPAARAIWEELRPSLRAAAERWGLSDAPGRYNRPLTAGWLEVFDACGSEQARLKLSRFIHYAAASGTTPGEVTNGHITSFSRIMESEQLIRAPTSHVRETCIAWNRLAEHHASLRAVRVPSSRTVYAMEPQAFSPCLNTELLAYLAFRGKDVPVSGRTPLRPASVASVRHALVACASAIVRSGCQPTSLMSLEDISRPDRVRQAITFLMERSGGKRTKQMSHFTSESAALARLWVRPPPDVQRELDELRSEYAWHHRGMASKYRALLCLFDDQSKVSLLLSAPMRLEALSRRESDPRRSARIMRDAVAMEIMLNLPMRPAELLQIRLGDLALRVGHPSFLRLTQHRNLLTHERRVPLSNTCACMIDRYLRRHRQLLVADANDALFPGTAGRPLGVEALRRGMRAWTVRLTGFEMSPTAFRHFAAKHYLERHPGDFGVVRSLLGHKSVRSTVHTYRQLEAPAATRRVDRLMFAPNRPNLGNAASRLNFAKSRK